jgi:hypothetical protein
MESGKRVWQCGLSTVDTTFSLAGMPTALAYFQDDSEDEREIRTLADALIVGPPGGDFGTAGYESSREDPLYLAFPRFSGPGPFFGAFGASNATRRETSFLRGSTLPFPSSNRPGRVVDLGSFVALVGHMTLLLCSP